MSFPSKCAGVQYNIKQHEIIHLCSFCVCVLKNNYLFSLLYFDISLLLNSLYFQIRTMLAWTPLMLSIRTLIHPRSPVTATELKIGLLIGANYEVSVSIITQIAHVCMCVSAVPLEARRCHQFTWSRNHRWLWVLGTEF